MNQIKSQFEQHLRILFEFRNIRECSIFLSKILCQDSDLCTLLSQ